MDWNLEFGRQAVLAGALSSDQVRALYAEAQARGLSLGLIAVQRGLLRPDQAEALQRRTQAASQAGQPATRAEQFDPTLPAGILIERSTEDATPTLRGDLSDHTATVESAMNPLRAATAMTVELPGGRLPGGGILGGGSGTTVLSPEAPGATRGLLLESGQSIDGYQVLSELGRGGTGVVYLVEKEGERCALKLIALEDERASERFRREGVAAAAVSDHPSIVGVRAFASWRGRPYLVMDYVDGGGLDAQLVRGRPLPLPRALSIVRQMAEALAVIHARGILHRDLKPANILIRRADGAPLLTDFGLARALDFETLTRSGDFLGTPAYMSPEQAGSENKAIDKRSDVWSLGVVLYELATGWLPFEGDTPVALIRRIILDDPAPPRRHNPELPEAVERVILKALRKEPERRYQSMAELAAELERCESGGAVEAEREAAGAVVRRRLDRRYGRLAVRLFAAGAALSLLLAPAAVWIWRRQQEQRQASEAFRGELAELESRLAGFPLEEQLTVLAELLSGESRPENQALHGEARALIKEAERLEALAASRPAVLDGEALAQAAAPLRRIAEVEAALTRPAPAGASALAAATRALADEAWPDASFQFQEAGRSDEQLLGLGRFGEALVFERQGLWEDAAERFAGILTAPGLSEAARAGFARAWPTALTQALSADEDAQALVALPREVAAALEDGPRRALWDRLRKGLEAALRGDPESLDARARLALRLGELAPQLGELGELPMSAELHGAVAERARSEAERAYHLIRRRLLDPRAELPPDFSGARLVDLITSEPGFRPQDGAVLRRSFDLLMGATRAGLYIPARGQLLARYEAAGLFEQELRARPEDPSARFWQTSVPISEVEDAQARGELDRAGVAAAYQARIEAFAQLEARALAPVFQALAIERRVGLQRGRLAWQRGGEDTQAWVRDVERALALPHPKPENIYQLMYGLLTTDAAERRLELAQARVAAIRDRADRTEDGRLGEGRPPGAALAPLDRSEERRLMASANGDLAEALERVGRLEEALAKATAAFEVEPERHIFALRRARILLALDQREALAEHIAKISGQPYFEDADIQAIVEAAKGR